MLFWLTEVVSRLGEYRATLCSHRHEMPEILRFSEISGKLEVAAATPLP